MGGALTRDAYQGERLFVLGTGPSLKDCKLEGLKSEYTFGVNGLCAWKNAPKLTFYGLSEHGSWERWATLARDTFGGATFIGANQGRAQVNGWYIVDRRFSWPLHGGHFGGRDAEFTWVAMSYSVVYELCLQAAFWLGFQEVYLLGCDHKGTEHVYQGHNKYQPAHLSTLIPGVQTCLDVYSQAGRKLIDCTPESGIGIIPHKALEEVL